MSDYNDGLIPEPCLRLDYGFGQQYASVELGDGTGYVRVTDDLRGEHHKMERWYDDELRAALAENKKLRRLVKQMHPLAVDYLYLMRQLGHIDDVSYEWAMQLQKLGIEVD